jgi:hypothetical protein
MKYIVGSQINFNKQSPSAALRRCFFLLVAFDYIFYFAMMSAMNRIPSYGLSFRRRPKAGFQPWSAASAQDQG